MKNLLIMSLIVLSFGAKIIAASASADEKNREQFSDVNGTKMMLRPATQGDFSNPLVVKDLSENTVADRMKRAENNQIGVFVIENESEVMGRFMAGNLCAGYQDASKKAIADDAENRERLNQVLSLYEALGIAADVDIMPAKTHRHGGLDILHVNPGSPDHHTALLFATIGGFKGPFATISAFEALAASIMKNGMIVPEDLGVTKPGAPHFLVVLTQEEGFESTPKTTVYPNIPIYPSTHEKRGMFNVVVTPTKEGVTLPAPGSYSIRDFASEFGDLLPDVPDSSQDSR